MGLFKVTIEGDIGGLVHEYYVNNRSSEDSVSWDYFFKRLLKQGIFDDWLEDEKSAVQDGTARFDYTPYYQEARDSLVRTMEKFTKVEKYL
jgi:deoxyadenosine/deoxycytidine kinase